MYVFESDVFFFAQHQKRLQEELGTAKKIPDAHFTFLIYMSDPQAAPTLAPK